MTPVFLTASLATLTAGSVLLILYHHLLYPALLRGWRRCRPAAPPPVPERGYRPSAADHELPRVVVLIPAFNEARVIADKIRNLAALDYPSHRLRVVVACDGCEDGTGAVARAAAAEPECRDLRVDVLEFPANRGKLAAINRLVPTLDADLIALSDASALVSVDALLIAAHHFADARTGVVCGTYRLLAPFCRGESDYWRYQTRLRRAEAALGGPIGAHGALYLFRRTLFRPLPADTINDDFVLPMIIVGDGHRAVADERIIAVELERATPRQDWRRRQRIAAGNLQQVLRLARLLHPRFGGTALAFASGKGLRAIMPFLLLIAFAGSWALATSHRAFAVLAVLQSAIYLVALLRHGLPGRHWPKPVDRIHYVAGGYLAGLVGAGRYLLGLQRGWTDRRPASPATRIATLDPRTPLAGSHVHPLVRRLKRVADLVSATALLLLTLPLLPIVTAAIKLDSRGPVFFRQTRVGECRPDHAKLINIVKFRTMRVDAERLSGAVWAAEHDDRVTRVGKLLRRTRLDELPQLYNVLRGEMSLIGPRPERPTFHAKLSDAIPFYGERVFGVLPGITGYAQVNLGSDRTIADVRRKLFYDHAYAMALSRPLAWLRLDLLIALRTVAIMIVGPEWVKDHPLPDTRPTEGERPDRTARRLSA